MFELTAKANKEFEIKMYGTISEWMKVNARDFEKSMTDAINAGAKTIILPTHCPGGSVSEGIAMGTNIRIARSKGIKVIQRIDGISASMSAVIGSCCDDVEGAPFTRIMIHEGQWGAYGNVAKLRETADELERVNKDLAQMHADKINRAKPDLKRDADWVLKNWMAEGKDKWFTIDEAIKEGLADRKIAAVVKDLPKPEASLTWSWMEMAAHLDKHFDTTQKPKMDRDQLIKELGLKAEATDAEILAAITGLKTNQKAKEEENKVKEKEKTDSPPQNNQTAIEVIEIVAKERGVADEHLENIKKVAAYDVKLAMSLIPEKKKDEGDGSTKGLNLNELLKKIKGESGGSSEGLDRAKWTLRDWEQKDPKALQAMINKEPHKYSKLFEAAYGFEPKIDDIKELSITR